jgi:hypothetical protein
MKQYRRATSSGSRTPQWTSEPIDIDFVGSLNLPVLKCNALRFNNDSLELLTAFSAK